MEPTKDLIDELYREKVLQARRTPPGEKLVAGLDLFDVVCGRMISGIRSQFPQFGEAEVMRELHRRLKINRVLHEQGLPDDVLELVDESQ